MGPEALASWLLSMMLAAAPPGKSTYPRQARETAEEGRERYAKIADAVAHVSLDPDEKPVFQGERARERTAALMLAIAFHESGFRRDVDLGIGPHARGAGRYWCMMQVGMERGGKSPGGWTGPELVSSRDKCFRAGLRVLQRASGGCKGQGEAGWLRLYTSGRCDRGRESALRRFRTYKQWLAAHPMPDG